MKFLLFLLTFSVYAVSPPAEKENPFFSPEEVLRMHKGEDPYTIYQKKDRPDQLFLPPELQNVPYSYLILAKGLIKTPASSLQICNSLLASSRQKGLQYFSVTENKDRTLIIDSYTIKTPEGREKIPDPELQSIPAYFETYLFQNDNRAGKIVFQAKVRLMPDSSIQYIMDNVTPIVRFGIFRAEPHTFSRFIRLFPVPEGYWYYAAILVKLPDFLPEKKTAQQSFFNRTKAIIGFYRKEFSRP